MAPNERALFQDIFRAAGSVERLSGVLGQCAEWLGADSYQIGVDLPGRRPIKLHILAPLYDEPRFTTTMISYRDNPWWKLSYAGRVGEVFNTDSIPRSSDFLDSSLHQEVLKPVHFKHSITGKLFRDRDGWGTVAFNRHQIVRPYDQTEETRLARLAPYMAWALKLHLRLDKLELERTHAIEILERARGGAVVVDEKGRVLEANPEGERLLGRNGALCLQGLCIEGATPEIHAWVHARLGQACGRFDEERLVSPDAKSSVDRELELFPLSDPGMPKARAVLFAREEPPPDRLAPEENLRRRFGLTPAEAKVAMALADGLDPKQIAGLLDVSINTVRTHLARAFEKSGTKRQAQLVRLVLGAEHRQRQAPASDAK